MNEVGMKSLKSLKSLIKTQKFLKLKTLNGNLKEKIIQ